MPLTLDTLNQAGAADAVALLDGIYEHSPWVAEAALAARPFRTLAQLKHALCEAVSHAPHERQLTLLRAHPELAGRAMVRRELTAESTGEQQSAGLTACSPEEFARLQTLNAEYHERFGWPFILAVRGPRGTGLTRSQVIAAFERRLRNPPAFEFAECLRQVHRIAELRINERFGHVPARGNLVWDWHEQLARHSEAGYAERGELTVTYLTDAHRACAAEIAEHMRASGFDEVGIDAVGNVVGRYHPQAGAQAARYLLTGSHYDTVRNGGKYDGRLGIFVPLACVRELAAAGRRLPLGIELVAFAEEEGQRYKTSFLGSSALVGDFRTEWLDQLDAEGIALREAMRSAGCDPGGIAALRRDPQRYLGFVEVHIEQGPVLDALNLPLGIVTSINGARRFVGEFVGMASHAGTTPMQQRHDAAVAAAELVLAVHSRARADADSVGTVGQLDVPNGSINVVPGRCRFTLDLRAPTDAQRDAMVDDVLAALRAIGERHGVHHTLEETMRAAAAPSHPAWQARWEAAVDALGLPVHRMPSGAGHDAMKLHEILPQAMLFVRGENAGISHNPLESTTSDDMDLAVAAFEHLLNQLAGDAAAHP